MWRKWIAVAVLVVAELATGSAVSAAGGAAAKKTVATVTTSDLRAVVVAGKSSGGSAPTARVTVAAYVRAAGRWHRVADRQLAGRFFWNTVSAPHAVCRLELTSAAPARGGQAQVTVQLLISPSIGCGSAQTFAFPAG